MPKIVQGSISILSDAGLGMAMFSLGKSLIYWRVHRINHIYLEHLFMVGK